MTPANALPWPISCARTNNGGNCTAACAPGYTGIGFNSTCNAGAWSNPSGSCRQEGEGLNGGVKGLGGLGFRGGGREVGMQARR